MLRAEVVASLIADALRHSPSAVGLRITKAGREVSIGYQYSNFTVTVSEDHR